MAYNSLDNPGPHAWSYAVVLMILSLPAWDALAGYTFVRLVQIQDLEICSVRAGAAAGAVYGSLTLMSTGLAGVLCQLAYCWSYV